MYTRSQVVREFRTGSRDKALALWLGRMSWAWFDHNGRFSFPGVTHKF